MIYEAERDKVWSPEWDSLNVYTKDAYRRLVTGLPPARVRTGREPINVARAVELYETKGMNWTKVGIQLAKEEGRPLPYTGAAVATAVHHHNKGRR